MMLNKAIHSIYYFFNGLMFVLLIIPNTFIKIINKIFNKHYQKINTSKKAVNYTIVGVAFSIYFISIYFFTRYYVQQERCKRFSESLLGSTEMIEEVEKNKTTVEEVKVDELNTKKDTSNTKYEEYTYNSYSYLDYINVDINRYTKINEDVVAWLKVEGTSINTSVVQSKDNSFYLNHDLYKKKSLTGWLFGDYRNDFTDLDNNTIIYGHNMANGTMFGTLIRVVEPYWYKKEKNKYIKLNTKNTKTVWEIFSIYVTDPVVDYLQTVFETDEEYNKFLNKMKARSIYKFNVSVSNEDKILTLQTCDNSGKKRIVVQAKLLKKEKY